MFREIILPIFRSTRLCVTACGILHDVAGLWPATSSVHYTTSCITQSSAPEDGRNHRPKHVELIGIIILLLPITLRPFQFRLGFLMVSEQYSFPGWGCQPHAHPQLSWRTDDFLSGLSPLADQSRF